jgi:hypothetical protein
MRGRRQLPADVRAHVDECSACRIEWEAALADAAYLPELLLVAASDRVDLALWAQLDRLGARPGLVAGTWRRTISWAVAGGALAAVVALSLGLPDAALLQALVFLAGAALTAGATTITELLTEV